MVDLKVEIIDLPTKDTVTPEDDFYFEIQEAIGGAGSSKKLNKAILYAAILAALPPIEHGSLTELGDDDHPQYLTNGRGDLRYAPISLVTAIDPYPQYHTDARGDLRYAPISLVTAVDPYPQYQKAPEVDAQIDAKVAALKAEANPFPIYETSAEAQAKVDAKMAAHLAAPNPHPQYIQKAELDAAIAADVHPVAEQLVSDLLNEQGEALIDAAVAEQVGPAVNDAIAAHEAAADPHPQYLTKAKLDAIQTLIPNMGLVTVDCALANYFYVELDQNATLVIGNPPPAGQAQSIYIQVKQNAVGGWSLELPAEFVPNNGSETEVDSTAGSYTDLAATTLNSGLRWAYSMQSQV